MGLRISRTPQVRYDACMQTLYRAWMKFAHVLGTINGYVLFTIIYVLGVGAYALGLSVTQLVRRQSREPRWEPKPPLDTSLHTMKRQF